MATNSGIYLEKNMKGYKHIKCKCGGIIGMYNRDDFICDKCNTEYKLHELNYDICLINDKTGWIFPVVDLKQKG